MVPERYTSEWCARPHFIIRAVFPAGVCYAVVPDGVQPSAANPVPSLRDARAWMRDNGFAPAPVQGSNV